MSNNVHSPSVVKRTVPTSLIGKGGVGLVMFHLARMGHEFSSTSERSSEGDLWVRFSNAIEAVEVKTSTGASWRVRPGQISRVSRVVFVNMERGYCWLLKAEAVRLLCAQKRQYAGLVVLGWREVEEAAEAAWHRQTVRLCPEPGGEPSGPEQKRKRNGDPAFKVVRKTLASGEVREYRYPLIGASKTTEIQPAQLSMKSE